MPYEVLDSPGRYEVLPAEQPSQGFMSSAWNSLKDEASAEVGRVGNIVAGGVKGASDIGTTILDLANRKLAQPALAGVPQNMRLDTEAPLTRDQRTRGIDASLKDFGADQNSLQFGAGRLAAQVAGTAGVGGLAGQAVRAAPVASPVANAIATGLETGGFRVPGLTGIPGVAARVGTGAATGGPHRWPREPL
jgi:hypothetical protein